MTDYGRPIHVFKTEVGGQEYVIEVGRFAEQAGGAVTVRVGDTLVFCAATMSRKVRDGQDFFPLSVDFEEKLYAVGRIPGSFQRREGRPSDRAILNSRVIDRTLRPLFPEEMLNEVQVMLTSLSHDQENSVDMIGILAASAALMISDIPWNGPVAGVRIGLLDGELVVNPAISQMEQSRLDLRVSGNANAINMVECGAQEVDEETMVKALSLAQNNIRILIDVQNQMAQQLAKPKQSYISTPHNAELEAEVHQRVMPSIKEIVAQMTARDDRNEAMEALREEVRAEYESLNENLPPDQQVDLKLVKEAVNSAMKVEIRRRITQDKIRPDGRSTTQIRPLVADVGLIPRVHGSGMFQRGQTQVLTIATLGTPRDSQLLDGLDPEETKRYMHHYNMPPFSTGETGFNRGPKRREIGHGALAENALMPMLPSEADFPYVLRLVSEVMSSNGSTSMASVCASTLSLMDAGVPLKRPVGGIAMGLIMEGEHYAVLTDIQGLEDHLGDMDFKVAGTSEGITALQMDIKIAGVTEAIMAQALMQAKDARMEILKVMAGAIEKPREELNPFAPRMVSVKIEVEKIGAVIGQGGKTIRAIQDQTGCTLDIQEDGTVFIAGPNGAAVLAAQERVRGLVEDLELGQIYTGKIMRLESYGVFVELLPGKEGLVHISQLSDQRIESVEAEFKLGDEIMVMVTDIEPGSGRVRLSRQAVMEGWTLEEARDRDQKRGGGGGGDRRGGGGGGDRRGGGGGDRRSSGGGGGGGDRRGGGGYDRGGNR
jgi:polyribonucleotide nucleotidyltransferase